MSRRPVRLPRFASLAGAACVAVSLLGGCSTASLVLTAAGVATDTSISWEVAKHVYFKVTEDEPTPCLLLNSVQRALNARCEYAPGSIRRADLAASGLQECPLALATRDPRLWRALPELLDKGARIDACPASPLAGLAAAEPCPDFPSAAADVRQALTTLAESDPRAVRHDVFRMLGCPSARAAGLDRVLLTWLDRGNLQPGTLSFSPLGAAHPDLLVSRLGRELEVAGHTAESALGTYEGVLPSGFEEALRTSHWPALAWWIYRVPRLANLAPPTRGGLLGWVPLQRVLLPGFLQQPETQRESVAFLLARGADPRQKLPFDPGKTVLSFARQMKSPMLALLDPPAAPAAPARGERSTPTRTPGPTSAEPIRQAARDDSQTANGTGAKTAAR